MSDTVGEANDSLFTSDTSDTNGSITSDTDTPTHTDDTERAGDVGEVDESSDVTGEETEEEETVVFGEAPDTYEMEGLDFQEDPFLESLSSWGKEAGLTNDGMKGLVGKIQELVKGQGAKIKEQTMKELGESAKSRIKAIDTWGKAKLSKEEHTHLRQMVRTTDDVKLIEKLIAQSKSPKLANAPSSRNTLSAKDLRAKAEAMLTEKNEWGGSKMDSDPEHAKKVNDLYAKILKMEGNNG